MKKGYVVLILMLMAMGCGDSKSGDADSGADTASEPPATGDTATSQTPSDTSGDAGTVAATPTETETEDLAAMECFITEPCGAVVPNERQICPFPLTPTLDGDTNDTVWASANWETVTSSMAFLAADSDADASFDFACVADTENIYLAFRVRDDAIVSGENTECEIYMDDSIEFYIDGCYGRQSQYDGDDAQITIGAENIGVTDPAAAILNGGCGNPGTPLMGADTGSLVLTAATADGWAGEIAIPLSPPSGWSLEPVDGQIIGFNAHYNDDDDQGDRDHKLIWGLKDRAVDLSWSDTHMFEQLQFCAVPGTDTGTGTGTDTGSDTGVAPDAGDEDAGEPDTAPDTADTADVPDTTATDDMPDTETGIPDAGDDGGTN